MIKVNRLSLNVFKICYMVISNRLIYDKMSNVSNKVIKRLNYGKNLEVTIDDKISITQHVENIV